jgi:hypothetical protein
MTPSGHGADRGADHGADLDTGAGLGSDGRDEARQLLLDHADRAVTGSIADPAVLAAVAAVERFSVVLGSVDPVVLRAALQGQGDRVDTSTRASAIMAEALTQVQIGLARRAHGQPVDAGLVNHDAGSHGIATDAVLLRAAVRAAQRSYDEMPYYTLRYGERGARFATSDSAWLLSLAVLDEARAIRQVDWLSRVLAARGMPSWLLETHLVGLVAEVRTVADASAVGALPAAAESLASARRRHVDDDLLSRADTWVLEALAAPPVPHTGALMAAAVADVLGGLVTDDSSLMDWLTDPARLPSSAAAALHQVRDVIRERAMGPPDR